MCLFPCKLSSDSTEPLSKYISGCEAFHPVRPGSVPEEACLGSIMRIGVLPTRDIGHPVAEFLTRVRPGPERETGPPTCRSTEHTSKTSMVIEKVLFESRREYREWKEAHIHLCVTAEGWAPPCTSTRVSMCLVSCMLHGLLCLPLQGVAEEEHEVTIVICHKK